MKCTEAREIMNLLFDGEDHLEVDAAREHLGLCASCREWHAGMERVIHLADSVSADLDAPNLRASIMARLPDRHPASVRRRRNWVSPRTLGWVAAGWLAGLLILIAAGLVISRWLAGPSVGGSVVLSYDLVRAAFSVGRGIAGALGVLSGVLRNMLHGATPYAVTSCLVFLALDSAFLCAVFLIWRTRRRIPGAMSILV